MAGELFRQGTLEMSATPVGDPAAAAAWGANSAAASHAQTAVNSSAASAP